MLAVTLNVPSLLRRFTRQLSACCLLVGVFGILPKVGCPPWLAASRRTAARRLSRARRPTPVLPTTPHSPWDRSLCRDAHRASETAARQSKTCHRLLPCGVPPLPVPSDRGSP